MTQTVLLIDDDEAMRRSTEQALELAGFSVQSFPSAEAALPLIGPGFTGAVISDIRMPGMDGMSLLERLTLADRDLPVITGIILLSAVVFVVVNIIVEFTHPLIDPRLRRYTVTIRKSL